MDIWNTKLNSPASKKHFAGSILQSRQTATSAFTWLSTWILQNGCAHITELKSKMYKWKSRFRKCSKGVKHLLWKKQMLGSSPLGYHLTIHVTQDQTVHRADPLLSIWDLKQWFELCFLPSAPEDTKGIKSVNTKHA